MCISTLIHSAQEKYEALIANGLSRSFGAAVTAYGFSFCWCTTLTNLGFSIYTGKVIFDKISEACQHECKAKALCGGIGSALGMALVGTCAISTISLLVSSTLIYCNMRKSQSTKADTEMTPLRTV